MGNGLETSIEIDRFNRLPPAQRALVALAILLDGQEASTYLIQDAHSGYELSEVARMMSNIENSIRMPLLGTELRSALLKLNES